MEAPINERNYQESVHLNCQNTEKSVPVSSELLRQLTSIANLEEEELPQSETFERLIAAIYKANRKRRRRKNGQARKSSDRITKKAAAGARAKTRNESVPFEFENQRSLELSGKSNRCYACNQPYSKLHPFYHLLCIPCGDVSFAKRDQSADLIGRTALVTGGRIKIGFEAALKLLRAGCHVHVTTRFSADAAVRFSEQVDFEEWASRLTIHRVDFRNLPGLLEFIESLKAQIDGLDLLINNAAQSVKRSETYHRRLAEFEATAKLTRAQQSRIGWARQQANAGPVLLENDATAQAASAPPQTLTPELRNLIRDDDDRLDEREQNTWNMRLSDVDPLEILEVMLINANAPALLVRGLRETFCRSQFPDRFIVNVSGADGTFNLSKSGFHSHVNMSKAAANMMTRSCCRELARDGIYINSVDTGWITHEGSFSFRKKRLEQGFVPPYDVIDGAARVLDPIFRFAGQKNDVPNGILFRNFKPSPW